ncbi:hypothetical protein SEHO0A_00124 [Salmonella enterica subsp. houtenae str. ATCC BAA-1581]|nr:hypothetical protein SEHO0A_00124 [Salmonella enterica subsp. houtenae str. ATCC BAA-1581]ENZ88349.1 hypothetical protein D088_970165 [Salmonella enterica subsp. houtenae serovar 16:z4,z32:-- str. RKS3027]
MNAGKMNIANTTLFLLARVDVSAEEISQWRQRYTRPILDVLY